MPARASSKAVDAANNGLIDELKQYLQKGDTEDYGDEKRTLLYSAAGHGKLEAVKFLLEQKANINAVNKDGFSVLQVAIKWAIKRETMEVIKYLISQGADYNHKFKGMDALAVAQYYHFKENPFIVSKVRELIEQKELEKYKNTLKEKEQKVDEEKRKVEEDKRNIENVKKQLEAEQHRLETESARLAAEKQQQEAERMKQEAKRELEQKEASAFLKLVADGEQDKAEALLKAKPALALCYSEVKDMGGRTFKRITAFQYAVWALDWHMWTMLQEYLLEEQAAQQYLELESKGTEHGKAFNLQPLIDAYKTYKDNYDEWNGQQRRHHWCKVIGGQQRLLPVHVLNEYCYPNRPFSPCPTFTDSKLPRSLPGWLLKEGALVNDLGTSWSVLRWMHEGPTTGGAGGEQEWRTEVGGISPFVALAEQEAVSVMSKLRTEQRKMLVLTLLGKLVGETKVSEQKEIKADIKQTLEEKTKALRKAEDEIATLKTILQQRKSELGDQIAALNSSKINLEAQLAQAKSKNAEDAKTQEILKESHKKMQEEIDKFKIENESLKRQAVASSSPLFADTGKPATYTDDSPSSSQKIFRALAVSPASPTSPASGDKNTSQEAKGGDAKATGSVALAATGNALEVSPTIEIGTQKKTGTTEIKEDHSEKHTVKNKGDNNKIINTNVCCLIS